MTLHPRERRLALIAGVIIGCWLLVSWLVQPLWNRSRDLILRVAAQEQKLDALRRLLAELPTLEQRYQQVIPYLSPGDSKAVQRTFLGELETLSRQSNLQLNLKPHDIKQEDRLARFEVEVDLEGAQAQLFSFLDGLLHAPRLFLIDRLRISSVPTKSQWLRANLVIQQLTVAPAE